MGTNSSGTDVSTDINSSGTDSTVSQHSPETVGATGGEKLGVSNQPSNFQTDINDVDNSVPVVSSTESVTSPSAENPNSMVQPISAEPDQLVTIGDVSHTGTSAQRPTTDRQSYAPGDTAVITVNDSAADVDHSVTNTVMVVIGSSITDPNGSTVTLTETAPGSGVFVGSTQVPTTGSSFRINYDASHPQARAVLNGVTQPGSIELSELPVSSFNRTLGLGFGQPAVVIGNGMQVTFLDGADVALNSECESRGFSQGMGCGGSTQITMSYANAPANLNGLPENSLTIWQFVPLIGWINLADCPPCGNIQRDPNAKTVTATSPFGPGVYVIGSPDAGGAGGGGGGAGFPGAGVVLDLVAQIVAPPVGPPPIPEQSSVQSPTIQTPDSSNKTSASTFTTGVTRASLQQQVSNASGATVTPLVAAQQQNTPFNTTIAVPGVGNVTLSFSNLGSQRYLGVTVIKPSDASSMNLTNFGNGEAEGVYTLNKTRYNIVGPILNISPADLKFTGALTLVIPYNSTLAPESGENIRMLEYTGSSWDDVTIKPPANGHIVTGSLTSLGPVVAAVRVPET